MSRNLFCRAFLAAMIVVLAALPNSMRAAPSAPPTPDRAGSLLMPPANGPRRLPAPDPGAVIRDAVVHVKPGVVLDHADVVLKDGLIAEVRLVEAPATTEPKKDEPARLHVYAAFIDPYVEVVVDRPDPASPGAHWNTRITPQRTALDSLTRANIDDATAESLRKLGFGTACISPRGGIFRGSSAVVSLAKPGLTPTSEADPNTSRPLVYRDHVYQTVGLSGGGFGGGGEGAPADRNAAAEEAALWPGYPGSLMGVIAVIRQTMLDADYLSRQGETSSIPSCLAVLGKNCPPLLFDADDELDEIRAIKIADEFGRARILLGSGQEYRRIAAIVERLSAGTGRPAAPLILPLNFPEAPKIASISDSESVDLRDMMAWEQAPTNPRRLDEAGVKFSLTTARLRDRGEFKDKLNEAIKSGLSADTALGALTTRPAELLGVAESLGTVEVGKRASIVVADGPLLDPKAKPAGKIVDLYVDGVRHQIAAPKGLDLEGEWSVTLDPAPAAPGEISFVFDADNKLTIKKVVPKEQPAAPAAGDVAPAPPAPPPPPAPAVPTAPAAAAPGAAPGAEAVKPQEPPAAGAPAATTEEKTAGAQNFRLIDHSVSFTFDHEPFGSPGVFMMTGLVEAGSAAKAPLRERPGTITGIGTRSTGETFRWVATRKPPVPKEAPKPDAPPADGAKPEDAAKANQEPAGPQPLTPIAVPFGPYGQDALPPVQHVVIEHGTIWTSSPAGVIQNGVLRLDDGAITFVGTAGDYASFLSGKGLVAPDVTIDATGKHVTPGLIDCHSHTGISGGVNEGGQAVTAECRIADVTNPDAISWYRQLGGGITCVNNLHGSANVIGGQNCVNKNRWGCAVPDDMHFQGAIPGIKFALGENPKGSNWGDDSASRYPQTRMGVESLLRDRFTAAREYRAARAASPDLVPIDLELEPLAQILDGTRLIHCHSYRQDEILMLCRVARDFGFHIGTFQHVLEGYKVADAIRESVTPGGGGSCFSDWWAYKVEVQDAIPYDGAIMHDVGVNVSFNSDSDEMARRMNVEAAKAMKYGGLSPEESLKFVTINPARQLQIDKRVGSLEPGKDADVALWSGSPLSSMSRCEATWVDGRMLFSLEQDRAARERITAERLRLIQKILKPDDKKKDAAGEGRPGGDSGGGPGRRRRRDGGPGAPPSDSDQGDEERRSILGQMLSTAQDARRERLTWLFRMGLDPAQGRAGECGCEETGQ